MGKKRKSISKIIPVQNITPAPISKSCIAATTSKKAVKATTSTTTPMSKPVEKTKKLEPSKQESSGATSSEQARWQYDVYAQPFVTNALRSINLEQARIVLTPSEYQIDYQTYIQNFVGNGFLSERPSVSPESNTGSSPPMKELSEQTYLQYFNALWKLESAAKESENDGYALYKTSLQRASAQGDEEIWMISVPGLREDSPNVEMGDTIHIRQLWVDIAGNLMQLPSQVTDKVTGHVRIDQKVWTGLQLNASVRAVKRAQETIYVKVEGLTYHYAASSVLMVNVVFPLKQSWYEQQRALACVDAELRQANCPLHRVPTREEIDDEFLDKFDEVSTGVQYSTKEVLEKRLCTPHNDWIRRILFPTEAHAMLQTQLRRVPARAFFDHAINYEQAHAVKSVCVNEYGTLPFLISGPPGTGKTKTLVETAMQLLNDDSTNISHMLICAPSEAASDTLTLRLMQHLNSKQLFRLNRPGRANYEVPRELMAYCHMEDGVFNLPPFGKLMSFNVVVTSCRNASILAEARLTNNDLWTIETGMFSAFHPEEQKLVPSLHWGALLLDEAAQATEMDVLPAISVICPPSAYPEQLPQPRFVMAGDEHQLGPRTASRDPLFSTSLFARLFNRPLYKDHPLSRSNLRPSSGPPVLKQSMLPIYYPPFANLIRNYRSHPAILSVPSSVFYNDTLIPEAQMPNTPLQDSSLWKGRKWPVLFFPHTGSDDIERDGSGWYNHTEARRACDIAQTLVFESHVAQSDICIMSPFAAQVKILRSLIRSTRYGSGSGMWDVNIGPLEAFQGLESRVVIICTTRTRDQQLGLDAKRGWGIVGQKRKMNVALTRAKEALFVIGSPSVLLQDYYWRAWLAFCWRNGLVNDAEGLWKGDDVDFGKHGTGVLERALTVKKEQHKGKALGAGADTNTMSEEYEAWHESLREALNEENLDGDADVETERAEYEEDYGVEYDLEETS
ncbi:P-loop containing nucleoside triphosphate hydrolase protein [Dothidotthia symphoricarpi CBS 119687]|uniref:P-loop containing nucleoside triphosphate hydrolase protein n=1 Tax=Dothidotthia symphoricarpi CBS 119687 TaxID=1392245 RepID=A0A6A6AFA4_9PLEO|nr:P-loop containing nucleoside triphosphate hydrolase protein [Dothidotthia symphoricarpi CBS 119687]KAF2130236.1 P-loop containing nucleoside triphosphate hydrolase protein [Dothidotthia symphoricarpi CBS 119687]